MISCIINNKEQLNTLLNNKQIDEIVIDIDCFLNNQIKKITDEISIHKKKSFIRLERITRYDEIKNLKKDTIELLNIENINGVVIENFDQYIYILKNIDYIKKDEIVIELDYSLNIANTYAKDYYKQLLLKYLKNKKINVILRFVSNVELNKYELEDIKIDTLVVYGYLTTMVSANCIYKTSDNCLNDKNLDKSILKKDFFIDRKNNKIYFKCFCKYCYNKIYNAYPLYIVDLLDELKKTNFDKIRYDFTIESSEEIKKILSNNVNINKITRGHIKNKIY